MIDTHKLKRQLVAYSLTGQITNAFTEFGIPYLKARFGPQIAEKLPQVAEKLHLATMLDNEQSLKNDSEDEKVFLDRIRREQLLPAADLGGEYAEMCTQLGYIAMFGCCWPLTPIWSLINNFVSSSWVLPVKIPQSLKGSSLHSSRSDRTRSSLQLRCDGRSLPARRPWVLGSMHS